VKGKLFRGYGEFKRGGCVLCEWRLQICALKTSIFFLGHHVRASACSLCERLLTSCKRLQTARLSHIAFVRALARFLRALANTWNAQLSTLKPKTNTISQR
jgi:hypothetical protein